MKDWRTCPACGKDYALTFSSGAEKGSRVIACRYCTHQQVIQPPKPKEKEKA